MLTDAEIQSKADSHVADCYPSDFLAVHMAECTDPEGVYFAAEKDGGDSKYGLEVEGLVGDGGFFVDAFTGEVRHFGSGDFVMAERALGKKFDPDDLCSIVRCILKEHSERDKSPSGRRSWWQFWR